MKCNDIKSTNIKCNDINTECMQQLDAYVRNKVIQIDRLLKEMANHPERFLLRYTKTDSAEFAFEKLNPSFLVSFNRSRDYKPTCFPDWVTDEKVSQGEAIWNFFNDLQPDGSSMFHVFWLSLSQLSKETQDYPFISIVDAKTLQPTLLYVLTRERGEHIFHLYIRPSCFKK